MVVRDEVGRRLQMTQGQEQAYYEAHKQEFMQPEQIKLSEILVPTAADANDAAIAQAQAKADGIEAKLKAGRSSKIWRRRILVDRRRHRAATWECISAGRWQRCLRTRRST